MNKMVYRIIIKAKAFRAYHDGWCTGEICLLQKSRKKVYKLTTNFLPKCLCGFKDGLVKNDDYAVNQFLENFLPEIETGGNDCMCCSLSDSCREEDLNVHSSKHKVKIFIESGDHYYRDSTSSESESGEWDFE